MACDSAVSVTFQCAVLAVHRGVPVMQRSAMVLLEVPNVLRQLPSVAAMMQRRAMAHYVVREVPLMFQVAVVI